MKKIFLISLAVSLLISCQIQNNNKQALNDPDWSDALSVAVAFAEISVDELFLYDSYDNKRLTEIISAEYKYGAEEFGYQLEESKLDYIEHRKNSPIPNSLDSFQWVKFTNDTIGLNEAYIVLSEPFHVDSMLVMYSMTYRNSRESEEQIWIYYLQEQEGKMKTKLIYDVNNNEFFESVPLDSK